MGNANLTRKYVKASVVNTTAKRLAVFLGD